MADEYISRKAAMEYLYRAINADPDGNCPSCVHDEHDCQYDRCWTLMDFCEKIEYLGYVPAADVVPVRHGRWEKKHDNVCYWYECSECGEKPPKDQWKNQWLSSYCPNCGAYMMDGEA